MSQVHRSSLTTRVLKAVAMLGSAQATNILCSVIRVKLIALWLGPIGTGLNTILLNGASMVSTATQLNLRDSAVRDLSLPSEASAADLKAIVVRRWALLLGFVGAAAMIILAPVLSASAYGGSTEYTLSFASLAPFVFFSAYSSGEFAILQSRDRMKKIAHANMAAGIAATALSIPLIYFLRLRSIVLIINIFAIMVAACALIWRERGIRRPDVKLSFSRLWAEGKSFLKLGAAISVSLLVTTVINYAMAAYINSTGGEADLGIYQSGYTLVNSYVGIIFSAIVVEYYPRLTHYVGRPLISRAIMTHELLLIVRLLTPIAIIFIACSPFIVKLLYSSQYEGVIPFVSLAIIGAIFRGISLCYAYRILAAGDSKAYIITESLSSAFGLTVNILGYRYGSYAGLGISYIIWYVFYTVLTASVCRVRYKTTLPAKTWVAAIASTAICVLTIVLWRYLAWWLPLVTILPLVILAVLWQTNNKKPDQKV